MSGPRVINALNVPFPVTVEVHFDTSMLVDSNLVDPNNYLFNNGAYTIDVEIINDKHIMLHVENLFENNTFTLNVQNVKSITGEIIDQNHNTATFFIDRPSVPGFASAITSSNGRLKSGNNVLDIQISDSNWYLMTESGIDVIDKISLMNKGYVLDGYGFNTIYVNRN